jgi:hypothetical protein
MAANASRRSLSTAPNPALLPPGVYREYHSALKEPPVTLLPLAS